MKSFSERSSIVLGVIGLAFAMRHVAQLLLMCDRGDVGVSIDGGSLEKVTRTGGKGGVPEALQAEPNVFIYDNYPGGIGFSRPLFEMHDLLLARTRQHSRRRVPGLGTPSGATLRTVRPARLWCARPRYAA